MQLWALMDQESTLANILSGKSGYNISGSLKYEGKNLQDIPIEERIKRNT